MNAIILYRLGRWCLLHNIPFLPKVVQNLIFLMYNSYIPLSAEIGEGTVFAYGGIGVVIHAQAKIGGGCVIGQGVTVGAAEAFASSLPNKCPVIFDNCYIGAGARLLGDITIGSGCQIGAGSVVLSSIPDHSVVAGIPAKVLKASPADYRAIR